MSKRAIRKTLDGEGWSKVSWTKQREDQGRFICAPRSGLLTQPAILFFKPRFSI
jgi:hypothetical protein